MFQTLQQAKLQRNCLILWNFRFSFHPSHAAHLGTTSNWFNASHRRFTERRWRENSKFQFPKKWKNRARRSKDGSWPMSSTSPTNTQVLLILLPCFFRSSSLFWTKKKEEEEKLSTSKSWLTLWLIWWSQMRRRRRRRRRRKLWDKECWLEPLASETSERKESIWNFWGTRWKKPNQPLQRRKLLRNSTETFLPAGILSSLKKRSFPSPSFLSFLSF